MTVCKAKKRSTIYAPELPVGVELTMYRNGSNIAVRIGYNIRNEKTILFQFTIKTTGDVNCTESQYDRWLTLACKQSCRKRRIEEPTSDSLPPLDEIIRRALCLV